LVVHRRPSASEPAFGGIFRGGAAVPAHTSLKVRIEECLRLGSELQAADLAFDGLNSENTLSRFGELIKLAPQDLGRLLDSRPRAERIEILRDLGNTVEIENREIGEAVSLILLDRQDLLNSLITNRGAVRKAARKFIFFGSMAYPDRYMEVYGQIQRENPSMYKSDWYDFLASDGQTVPGTISIRLREGYLASSIETLKDTNGPEEKRISAVCLLGILGAVEHFDYILSLARKSAKRNNTGLFDRAIAKSLSRIYGRLRGNDRKQKAQRANFYRAFGVFSSWLVNCLIEGGARLDLSDLRLVELLITEQKLSQEKVVATIARINHPRGIHILLWILSCGQQSKQDAFKTISTMDTLNPSEAFGLIRELLRDNPERTGSSLQNVLGAFWFYYSLKYAGIYRVRSFRIDRPIILEIGRTLERKELARQLTLALDLNPATSCVVGYFGVGPLPREKRYQCLRSLGVWRQRETIPELERHLAYLESIVDRRDNDVEPSEISFWKRTINWIRGANQT